MSLLMYWKYGVMVILFMTSLALFYWGKALKIENTSLKKTLVIQETTITDLNTALSRANQVAQDRLTAKDATIENIRKICNRKMPSLPKPLPKPMKGDTPIESAGNNNLGSFSPDTLNLLNGMFKTSSN